MKYHFNTKDVSQIVQHGLTVEQVSNQLARYKQGYPRTHVTSPVLAGKGVQEIPDEELDSLIAEYEAFKGTAVKFVPASGAATRMFKPLYDYLKAPIPDVNPFEEPLRMYPFYNALSYALETQKRDLTQLEEKHEYPTIINTLLGADGLNYGNTPKALIQVHSVPGGAPRTALEEHLVEAASYAKNLDNNAHLHFTVSPQYLERVQQYCSKVQWMYEGLFGVQYHISWSVQDPATDTIAVTPEGAPYRDEAGDLLFRPAGHGALLRNLQSLQEDIIFIKNIDNICPDRLRAETIRYKKCLAGILISTKKRICDYLEKLERPNLSERECNEILDFCRLALSYRLPNGVKDAPLESKRRYLKSKLNRPLRVCGMVKNEGEPGGGPFWVRKRDGSESLQIVETAQMDLEDTRIQEIVALSQYFNPVDIVCSIKNHRNEPYDLSKYVNKNTGFIAQKSVNGTPIQAIELPGLWNGCMAHWNTIFVEVPSITFTPIKTVLDLVRPEHQA